MTMNTNPRRVNFAYVPHGINPNDYRPIDRNSTEEVEAYTKFLEEIGSVTDDTFVVFFNSRNIGRKHPADIIWAYRKFCDMLPKEESANCVLLLHTDPVDNNGTNLPAVAKQVCPDYKVVFSARKMPRTHLNYLYNVADVTVNMSSNEGFGISTAESVMAGTPIIVNVTGGLQDQCGFKLNGQRLTEKDYLSIGTLHDGRKWKDNPDLTWGAWVIPVWASNISIQGSPPTPYIYDDRVDARDVADALKEFYDMGKDERTRRALEGREFFMSQAGLSTMAMCARLVKAIDDTIENFVPRKRFQLHKV